MRPFDRVASALVPMLDADVDTDRIVPAQYVNAVGRDALARALFARARAAQPDFVLDRPEMVGRTLMLTGPNFGCGSSREVAAWALEAAGFRALIGTTFNGTFQANCLQNGLLVVALPPHAHARLVGLTRHDPARPVAVDLVERRIDVGGPDGFSLPFDIEPFVRDLLLGGEDELAYLLARAQDVARYEAQRAPG